MTTDLTTIERPERAPVASRAEWLERRRHDVTASEVAALFDVHPFRTHLQVYLGKTRGEDQGDNPAMRRGRLMEPAVALAVAEEHPEWAGSMRKAGEYWRLPGLRLGSTPDYYIGEPGTKGFGVLECKTMSPEQWTAHGGAPPLAYTLQVAAQMMTTRASFGVIAVMVMTRTLDLYTFPVPRVAAAEVKIAEGVRRFWARVEAGEEPPPRMPADLPVLARMFPYDNGRAIDLSGDNELPGLLAERATLAGAKKRFDEISDAIRVKIGEAQRATLPGWSISYKTQHRKAYTVEATDMRVLRITAAKDSLDVE